MRLFFFFFFGRIFGLAITSYKIGGSNVKTLRERISFSIKLQKASPGGDEAIAGTFPLGTTGFLHTRLPGRPQTAMSAQRSVLNGFALCKQPFLSGCQNIASQLLITWARTELVIYTGKALCLLP